MTTLKTRESTLEALERATHRIQTADELQRQRISFIMGSLDRESNVTRAQVQEILAEQEGLKTKK